MDEKREKEVLLVKELLKFHQKEKLIRFLFCCYIKSLLFLKRRDFLVVGLLFLFYSTKKRGVRMREKKKKE